MIIFWPVLFAIPGDALPAVCNTAGRDVSFPLYNVCPCENELLFQLSDFMGNSNRNRKRSSYLTGFVENLVSAPRTEFLCNLGAGFNFKAADELLFWKYSQYIHVLEYRWASH